MVHDDLRAGRHRCFGTKRGPDQLRLGLARIHLTFGLIDRSLLQFEVRRVRNVITQHIENKTLVDGLAHRVNVKRLRFARVGRVNSSRVFLLRCSGESEQREVWLLAARQRRWIQRITGVAHGLGAERALESRVVLTSFGMSAPRR